MASAKPQRVTFPVIVHTFVFDSSGRLLLLRRANTGFLDGYFALPGGHLQRKEAIADAAIRECREESGIDVARMDPVVVMPFPGGVDFLFEAVEWSGEARIAEPDKCDALDWFATDALPASVVPYVRKALELRAEGTWYHQYTESA